MNFPSFSIVVPTYQRKAVVSETVRALCAVDYPGVVEIIVVVDGSSDGTAEALVKMDCKFPLRVIEQRNRGLAAARNRGAAEAVGDRLLFLDDDMICHSDVLLQHARSHAAGADMVVGDFIDAPGPCSQPQPSLAQHASRPEEEIRMPFGVFCGHFSVPRATFAALGGFDESFTADGKYGYEDTEFAHRLLKRSTVRRNPMAVSDHRNFVHPLDYVRRARSCAMAEQRLLAKHPELSRELYEWTGAFRISSKLRWASRLPLLPGILATLAAFVAEAGLRTPLRSSPKLARVCDFAYTLAYWSAVQRNGGIPHL